MAPKKSLVQYLEDYRREHSQLGTKITHMIGIPMILASLPIVPVNPVVGVGLFAGGWALQFVGHYVFEKNDPAFFGDAWNLYIGAIWAALEWAHLFGLDISIAGVGDDEAAQAVAAASRTAHATA
jgi:uncharacterized membrane protein YGL010W